VTERESECYAGLQQNRGRRVYCVAGNIGMEQVRRRNDGSGERRDNTGEPVGGLDEFEVLLIDDHASDAKLFEHALHQTETRARLYWVASAQEGLDYLKREGRFTGMGRVKLVISDLSMPGMDGFEFLTEARKNPGLATVPIVIFSSSRAPQDVFRCYRLGANSYITKPMALETFVDTIRTLVRYWLDIVELPDPRLMD
jgi:two-component system, chemotaxis family, response regulator Rcp1